MTDSVYLLTTIASSGSSICRGSPLCS